jgi:hypothetical protein
VHYFVDFYRFAIFRLIIKFVGLPFADLHTKKSAVLQLRLSPRMCGFAICELQKKFACPPVQNRYGIFPRFILG